MKLWINRTDSHAGAEGSVPGPARSRLALAPVLVLVFVTLLGSCATIAGRAPESTAAHPEQWRLRWHDEFSYTGKPNPELWNIEVLGPGAYNRELQAYTARPENVRVENNLLIIEARPMPGTKRGYTSARINTRNRNNIFEGRIEIRARLPRARGTWPALWFLPVDTGDRHGWPHSGEIDLMEHVGFDPGVIHASVHTSKYNWPNGNHHTQTYRLPSAVTEFHVYALEWSDQKLDFFIDDVLFTCYENEGTGWEAWPFDVPFYLIINLAVGGEWGGAQGVDRDAFPDRLEVDWVRVYEPADGFAQ